MEDSIENVNNKQRCQHLTSSFAKIPHDNAIFQGLSRITKAHSIRIMSKCQTIWR